MCDKFVLTQKNGARIMIERHTVSMVEEVVGDESAIVTHAMYGEPHAIKVLESFDAVMAMLYPEEHSPDSMTAQPGGMY
jgi:hypothetical protein